MKQLKPLIKFTLHFLLWLIPAFVLWWFSVNSVILPGLRIVVGEMASLWFHQEQVELHESKGDRWFVRTNLLTKKQPKDQSQRSRWTIYVSPLIIYTVGFPVLWAWFLATPQRRIFNQIVGNSIIFLLTTIVLWLLVFHSVATITASGGAEFIYSYGYLYPAPIYSKLLLNSLSHIQLLLAYFGCGLAVPIIWYAFNRDFVRKLIPKRSFAEIS
ncbi:exosortase H-associated membrane protein [Candidatus Halobeggiatoa sp. HSG11]|nr:exosortase H-associated membrane protein [Candidatus Halobeggiatoa sp. HSG11]